MIKIEFADSGIPREKLIKLFSYQPFVLPDGTITGSAMGQVHGESIRAMRQGECDESQWEKFKTLNTELSMMYEDIISGAKNLLGSFSGLTFADFACNSGYFCYRYLQEGAASATGFDVGDYADAFSIVNKSLNLDAKFINAKYDMMQHRIVPPTGKFDVVSCIAFMCHSSDPTYLLAHLGSLARRALIIMSKIPTAKDEFYIKYARFGSLYFGEDFPICFDAATEISEPLFCNGLESLGFNQVVEIPRKEYWQPGSRAWRCFVALRD